MQVSGQKSSSGSSCMWATSSMRWRLRVLARARKERLEHLVGDRHSHVYTWLIVAVMNSRKKFYSLSLITIEIAKVDANGGSGTKWKEHRPPCRYCPPKLRMAAATTPCQRRASVGRIAAGVVVARSLLAHERQRTAHTTQCAVLHSHHGAPIRGRLGVWQQFRRCRRLRQVVACARSAAAGLQHCALLLLRDAVVVVGVS